MEYSNVAHTHDCVLLIAYPLAQGNLPANIYQAMRKNHGVHKEHHGFKGLLKHYIIARRHHAYQLRADSAC